MHLDLKQTAPHMSLEEIGGGGFRMKDHSGLEFQIYLVNSLRKDGQVSDLPPASSLRVPAWGMLSSLGLVLCSLQSLTCLACKYQYVDLVEDSRKQKLS